MNYNISIIQQFLYKYRTLWTLLCGINNDDILQMNNFLLYLTELINTITIINNNDKLEFIDNINSVKKVLENMKPLVQSTKNKRQLFDVLFKNIYKIMINYLPYTLSTNYNTKVVFNKLLNINDNEEVNNKLYQIIQYLVHGFINIKIDHNMEKIIIYSCFGFEPNIQYELIKNISQTYGAYLNKYLTLYPDNVFLSRLKLKN